MLRKRSKLIEEREKKNKKIIYTRTVTVYICTVTIHLHSHGVYLHIFTQIDEGAFWVKMCKIEHILHFTHFEKKTPTLLGVKNIHHGCVNE